MQGGQSCKKKGTGFDRFWAMYVSGRLSIYGSGISKYV